MLQLLLTAASMTTIPGISLADTRREGEMAMEPISRMDQGGVKLY